MIGGRRRARRRVAAAGVLALIATGAGARDGREGWTPAGLFRVRDTSPFGISRLDMLPAHAVDAPPGTVAVEVSFSYQNTWVLSENVREYLEERGVERGEIGPAEIAALEALPGDAYLVDGELGLVDLTLHYRAARRLGLYATIPYFTFSGGFLDSTIEGFQRTFGFSTADRDLVPRDGFLVVADLEGTSFAIDTAPRDEFGDPVLGLRSSLGPAGGRWRAVLEWAVKLPLFDSSQVVSTGSSDYGLQVSLQRFFRRNALYLSLAGVYYQTPDPGLADRDRWIPTAVAGWETRIGRHTSFILQGYVSESTVRETDLPELSATKIQATAGIQWLRGDYGLRFGVTENVANYENTPDIGLNLGLVRIFFGSGSRGSDGDRPRLRRSPDRRSAAGRATSRSPSRRRRARPPSPRRGGRGGGARARGVCARGSRRRTGPPPRWPSPGPSRGATAG